MKVVALLSMLHEPASPNSATRMFHGRRVLSWALARLQRSSRLAGTRVVCWDDQREVVVDTGADAHPAGPRTAVPGLEAIAAARRWADGWRGGLLNSTEFDLGFHGPLTLRACSDADAVVLINPSAAMIDAGLVDRLIDHAAARSGVEHAFLPVACGFAAELLRRSLLERLAAASLSPGRLFSYQPDAPMRDPLAGDGCVEVPLLLARSQRRFTVDCDQQIRTLEASWPGDGQELLEMSAERLAGMVPRVQIDPLPRDIVVETCTNRATQPIFGLYTHHPVSRPSLSPETAGRLFDQVASRDNARLTLGVECDPLASGSGGAGHALNLIALADRAGVRSVHIRTDLLPADRDAIDALAESTVEVVSVHIPATTPQTYAAVMGVDRLGEVIENVRRFVTVRNQRRRGVPVLAPTFTKTRENLAEMETWYDQWLRAVGTAVIVGPSTFAGAIPDVGVGDMSPPKRLACRRLASRVTVLSDGSVVSCEEDLRGRQIIGNVNDSPLDAIWAQQFGRLRQLHADQQWDACEVCRTCSEWHRP